MILTKIDGAELIIIIVLKDVQLNKVSEIYYRQLLLQSSPAQCSLQWLYLYMASQTPLYYQISHRVRFGLMITLVRCIVNIFLSNFGHKYISGISGKSIS